MDNFEQIILRWVCLFDDFKDNKYPDIKHLVSSISFKEFVDSVFCLKCSAPSVLEDEKLYNTIKVNYQEFEIQKFEDLFNEENTIYTCVVVLVHALLKCTNNKFRDQLSERMDSKEQVLLAKFLEATQSLLFTRKNITEALMIISDAKHSINISEIFSNNITPVKKSMGRSYLQEFCESPKSQSLINQEKEKLIVKLAEDYKNECEENYKLSENVKILQDLNTKLSNKIEDKDKIIQFLKDEIDEFSKPKESPIHLKSDNALIIEKLKQDILDLEMSSKELKHQLTELENTNYDLSGKLEKKNADYEDLTLLFDNIDTENVLLKEKINSFKEILHKKDTEIISLKDELDNKSISNHPTNTSCHETINVASNTLFDELSCIKLEETTRDKEKYRHKYKSVKKDLLNAENRIQSLDEQLMCLKQQLNDFEVHKNELINKLSDKKKDLLEYQKKNNNLESKIKHLKDSIKDKENHVESVCKKLDKKESQIKELIIEMDTIKKAKNMIELILSKTNSEIEALHEDNDKHIKSLLSTIEDYKNLEESSHNNILILENNIRKFQDDLTDKNNIIIFYEEKMAENYQALGNQEEQLRTMYQEKVTLESHVKEIKKETEKQKKELHDKNRELEISLEYYLDELKDVKNCKIKVEEILNCKKNEIDGQIELINYQKHMIEKLESEKLSKEIIINELNDVLQQKSAEVADFKDKVLESTLNLNKLNEQVAVVLNEKSILEENIKRNEMRMKTSNEGYQHQIYEMKNILESRSNEINECKISIEKLKNALEKKQNDFNEQLIISNKQIETISHLSLEKYELEEKLKLNNQKSLDKENELQLFKEKFFQSELEIKNLTQKLNLKISENNVLSMNLDIITLAMKNIQDDLDKQYSSMENKLQHYNKNINVLTDMLLKLKNYLLLKENVIENQITLSNKQKEYILNLETEKLDMSEKLKELNQCLSNKNVEIINLRTELQGQISSIKDFEEQLGVMSIEKVMIETNLNETTEQFKTSQEQFTAKINNILIEFNNRENEIINLKNQSLLIQNTLENTQQELKLQVNKTLEQYEIIKSMKSDKELLEKQVLDANNHDVTTKAEIEFLKNDLDKLQCSISKLEKELGIKITEKTALETTLKETINEKKMIEKEFDEQIKEVKNLLKDSTKENNDLKNSLAIFNVNLNDKQIQFENLKVTVDYTENRCLSLQDKLNELSDNLLKKDDVIKSLEIENIKYLNAKDDLVNQVISMKQDLDGKHSELENLIQVCNEQRESIVKINCEKESLCDKIKNLEDTLSHKEYEFNLCEGKLFDCSNTINNLEERLSNIKKEKSSLEFQLNETITQLTNTNQDLTQKLEDKEKNIMKIEEKLIHEQNELKKQIEQSNEQIKTVTFLNAEKNTLLEDVNKYKKCLSEKESTLKSLKEKILENEIQSTNEHRESKQKLEDMKNKYTELQEKLNGKQIEINDYVNKYNCEMEKISNLASERDELIVETNVLRNTLLNKDKIISFNQKKLLEHEEQNNKIKTEKIALEIELKQANKQIKIIQKLENMESKLSNLQEELNCKNDELESCVEESSKHLEAISTLTLERNNLNNEIDALQNQLLDKENILVSNDIKLMNFETQLKRLQTQKICLELELAESKMHINDIQRNQTQKLEAAKTKLDEVEKQLICQKIELEEQNIKLNEQVEIINTLKCEKNNMLIETNRLKNCLDQNECILTSNQNKLQASDKHYKEIECQNAYLLLELNQLKSLLHNLRQETTEQIVEMDKKLCKTQERLIEKQIEIRKQIILKNDSLAEIYQKINDLKTIKNELELLHEKDRIDIETCLQTFSNYSLKSINNNPKQDHHQDSLMEVITSADTFIEQNGIQLARVEICDEYSIIERLKKLFEALKMFIININSQGNERVINEYDPNGAYAELLAKSNTQLETIKHLESEMSKLKAECNYKMTKIQQKTQEFITSEYEKKFERKREQMKQFCKDLETKIHQDYEVKLMKYKEKIKKDEAHIKELSHQLWEVSDKYLRLQQKDRRESTMSLPFEVSTISQTTTIVPSYSSFTLPKSSSAGQIRSLVEETSRNYENSKRNVPAGIGKKFSLSSGKIFPKEEDEEGEMFNHSCLADLKQGKVKLNDTTMSKQYIERLSELQARNSLCPPHLRSCYAVETNYLPTTSFITEEDIKTLGNYSDCESENLIPNDRNKKKDRNQTSYKKPGPPTPSKNGGRASLSSNAKITLKETNANKRRTSSTPNKLFSLFMSKKN